MEQPLWVSPEQAAVMLNGGYSFVLTDSDGSVFVGKRGLGSVCTRS